MAARTRIYTVLNEQDGAAWLVRATSQAQAIAHVTRHLFKAKVASQDEIVEAMQMGVTVTDATTEQPATEGEEA